MARNREFVKSIPPQSSDEEDDDDASSEGISETDSDASIKTPVKTQSHKEEEEEDEEEEEEEDDDDNGEEDDESGSETDSGSDSDSPAKPPAAKQVVEEVRIEPSKPRSKAIPPDSAATPVQSTDTPVQSAAAKRPAESLSSPSKESKKMKKAEDSSASKESKKTKKKKAADAEAEASEKKSFMKKIDEAEASEKKSVTKKSVTKKADEAESSEKKSVTKKADEEKKLVKKKADEAEASEKKSTLFQRLWSEDDELIILQGMIDYSSEKKVDPSADVAAFLDFIKEKLHVDVSKMQLHDKIRRLRKKYLNNEGKAKEGEERTFSKPHEHKSYQLSRQIWWNDAVKRNGSGAAKKTDAKSAGAERDLKNGKGEEKWCGDCSVSVGRTTEESMMMMGQQRLGGNEEWDWLKEQEFEAAVNQLKVKTMQYEQVLNHMRNKRNHSG